MHYDLEQACRKYLRSLKEPKIITAIRSFGLPEAICKAGGTSLAKVLGAHHFVSDLNAVYPALQVWHDKLKGAPIPFGAVRTTLLSRTRS